MLAVVAAGSDLRPAMDSFMADPPDEGFQYEYLAALCLLDRRVRRMLGGDAGATS